MRMLNFPRAFTTIPGTFHHIEIIGFISVPMRLQGNINAGSIVFIFIDRIVTFFLIQSLQSL